MKLPQTPSFRLDGRVALVAGASSGIGLGCAVALAEAGAHVICAARKQEQLEQVVSAIKAKGYSAEALQLDITNLKGLAQAFAGLQRLDIYVNSAGFARHSAALDTVEADFDSVMAVNWKAAHFSAREAARKMIEGARGGSIITISSQMGHVGGVDRAVYSASKHAVEGMTKAMAIEWGPQSIRVNTICPTFIRTPLSEPSFADPDRLAWIKSKIKLPRVGEVEDVMGAAVFLASDAAAMITGSALMIDGGWTAD
jgi:NAD(P)-dependent dehydrogenase (short-subunit alcohol dehydrogenase family)